MEPHDSLRGAMPAAGLILDAGAGDAASARQFSGPGRSIICLDIHPPVKGYDGDVPFVMGSIAHLPFKENAFDFVYCLSVVQLVEDDRGAVSELRRVLKKGGSLFFTVPTYFSVFHILRECERFCNVYPFPEFDVPHYHYYTKRRIREVLGEECSDAEIRGYQFNAFPRLLFFIRSLITGSCDLKTGDRAGIQEKSSLSDRELFHGRAVEKNLPLKGKRFFSRLFRDVAYHYLITARKG